MSDFPPPPPSNLPPPPPEGFGATPPGYTQYGQHTGGERAGFWIRFAAAFIDGLIYGIPVFIVAAAVSLSQPAQQLLSLVVGGAYFIPQESGPTGQTVGKKLCGIRVVDQTSGGPIDQGRAGMRYLVSILSGFACALGYLWMLWDDNKQTWHDKASQTIVIKA